jgi:hypothetical protein
MNLASTWMLGQGNRGSDSRQATKAVNSNRENRSADIRRILGIYTVQGNAQYKQDVRPGCQQLRDC